MNRLTHETALALQATLIAAIIGLVALGVAAPIVIAAEAAINLAIGAGQ